MYVYHVISKIEWGGKFYFANIQKIEEPKLKIYFNSSFACRFVVEILLCRS